jgi:hypothetical protein
VLLLQINDSQFLINQELTNTYCGFELLKIKKAAFGFKVTVNNPPE